MNENRSRFIVLVSISLTVSFASLVLINEVQSTNWNSH